MGEKADTTPSPTPNVISEYAFKGLSPLTRHCLHSRPSLSPPFLPQTRAPPLGGYLYGGGVAYPQVKPCSPPPTGLRAASLPPAPWELLWGRSPLLVTFLLLATHHPSQHDNTLKPANKPMTLWDKVLLLESGGGTDYKFSISEFWITLCDPKSAHNPPVELLRVLSWTCVRPCLPPPWWGHLLAEGS